MRRWCSLILVLIVILLVTACGNQSTYYPQTEVDATSETATYPVEYTVADKYPQEYLISQEEYPLSHVFSITHVISSGMEPLTFNFMAGERNLSQWGHYYYIIAEIQVTDAEGKEIQIINEFEDITRGVGRMQVDGWYGVFFGDFDLDGHLDIMLMGNRDDNYRWVWDPDAGRFEPWKPHMPSDDGEIDFNVAKSIHPDMPPFIFRMLGGYRQIANVDFEYLYRIVETIRITTLDGELLQELSVVYAYDRVAPNYGVQNLYGLHFADYNFDGYLDIEFHISPGGNRDRGLFTYWLWCPNIEQFVFNEQLRAMGSNLHINHGRRQIQSWWSHVGGRHNTFYEYYNGVFTPVEYLFWERYWTDAMVPEGWSAPEGEYNVRITRRDLVNGTEEVFYEFWGD